MLVPTVRTCYKNDKKYKAEKWLCPDCVQQVVPHAAPGILDPGQEQQLTGDLDTLEHIRFVCPRNAELRENVNFSDEFQEVNFFSKVISRRKEENKN